jgi:serine protease DegS
MRTLVRYLVLPALAGAVIGIAVLLVGNLRGVEGDRSGYADAVAKAAPAVVNIYSSRVIQERVHPICTLPRFRDLCDRFSGSNRRMQSSLGSGVVVRSDGYILTNAHIIEDASEILVDFNDGLTATADVVGTDPETDLAVIHVAETKLAAATIGASDAVRVGDVALAIGNPFGIGQTVSMGIISAKGRYGISPSAYDDFIQTDAAINPGNSGGALIDVEGRLIGINSLIYSQTGGYQGIGFAIPAQLAMAVLDEIIAEGRVIRGWLGIEVSTSAETGMGVGLVVTGVLPDSPAAHAGLARSDVILAINDQPAVTTRVLMRQIGLTEPGEPIRLNLVRNGEQLEVVAIAGVRPEPGSTSPQ